MALIDQLRYAHDAAQAAAGIARRYELYTGTCTKTNYDPGLSKATSKVLVSWTKVGHTTSIYGLAQGVVPFYIQDIESKVVFSGLENETIKVLSITKPFATGTVSGGYAPSALITNSSTYQMFWRVKALDDSSYAYYQAFAIHRGEDNISFDLELKKVNDVL